MKYKWIQENRVLISDEVSMQTVVGIPGWNRSSGEGESENLSRGIKENTVNKSCFWRNVCAERCNGHSLIRKESNHIP